MKQCLNIVHKKKKSKKSLCKEFVTCSAKEGWKGHRIRLKSKDHVKPYNINGQEDKKRGWLNGKPPSHSPLTAVHA
jgi:hypothetical protein